MSKSPLHLSREKRGELLHAIGKWLDSFPPIVAADDMPPLVLPDAEPEFCKQCGGPPGKRRRLRRQLGRVHQNGPCSDSIHTPRKSARARAGGKRRK